MPANFSGQSVVNQLYQSKTITMRKINFLLIAAALGGLLQACSGGSTSSISDSSTVKTDSTSATGVKTGSASTVLADTAFAGKAAIGGMAEVALGKLAGSKAADPKVKQFGNMMVMDHSKANAELTAIAQKKNISLPAGLDAEHQAKSDSLGQLSGRDFDKAYVSGMVADHKKTLALMQAEAQSGTDPELKAFAAKTAPVVQHHLDEITRIQANLK
jgi:putative membrane protein